MDQSLEEGVHPLAPQGDGHADRHALADLEAGDGLLGPGHHHLLAGDGGQFGDGGLERLGVLGRLTESPVDGDLDHLGNLVDVGEVEILQQLGLDRLPVALFE